MSRVGDKIRTMRKRRGQSLRDLAKKALISPGFLSQIENGRRQPSIKMLARLTQALLPGANRVFVSKRERRFSELVLLDLDDRVNKEEQKQAAKYEIPDRK